MFQDVSSSPTTMPAARACDAYGLFKGHDLQQADAKSAYTQAKLKGPDTWVRLPKDQWPQEWIDRKLRDPVCPLELALYGHPNSGAYWEEHCEKHLIKQGFKPIPTWRTVYWHPEHKTFLNPSPQEHKTCLNQPCRNTNKSEPTGTQINLSPQENKTFLNLSTQEHKTFLKPTLQEHK